MKAVLMSVSPEAVKRIASGRKRAEVRRTYPHYLSAPFTIYFYESRGRLSHKPKYAYTSYRYDGRGLVVGECVCNEVKRIEYEKLFGITERDACMTTKELCDYLDGKTGYIFRFTDVKMYDWPIPLEEFGKTTPPQSWCFVEERKEK